MKFEDISKKKFSLFSMQPSVSSSRCVICAPYQTLLCVLQKKGGILASPKFPWQNAYFLLVMQSVLRRMWIVRPESEATRPKNLGRWGNRQNSEIAPNFNIWSNCSAQQPFSKTTYMYKTHNVSGNWWTLLFMFTPKWSKKLQFLNPYKSSSHLVPSRNCSFWRNWWSMQPWLGSRTY